MTSFFLTNTGAIFIILCVPIAIFIAYQIVAIIREAKEEEIEFHKWENIEIRKDQQVAREMKKISNLVD